jgi:hypothetical protein
MIIGSVAEYLLARHPGNRPMRVGVDGITAAGKSTLAILEQGPPEMIFDEPQQQATRDFLARLHAD